MATRRDDRFPSAVDFARALQRVELELGYAPTTIEVPNLAARTRRSGRAAGDDADATRARSVRRSRPSAAGVRGSAADPDADARAARRGRSSRSRPPRIRPCRPARRRRGHVVGAPSASRRARRPRLRRRPDGRVGRPRGRPSAAVDATVVRSTSRTHAAAADRVIAGLLRRADRRRGARLGLVAGVAALVVAIAVGVAIARRRRADDAPQPIRTAAASGRTPSSPRPCRLPSVATGVASADGTGVVVRGLARRAAKTATATAGSRADGSGELAGRPRARRSPSTAWPPARARASRCRCSAAARPPSPARDARR